MKLTEAQLSNREELFYELVEFLVNETYETDVDYVMTEDDESATLIAMEYFIENFKEPTLQENIACAMGGVDINEELYLEFIEAIILDESIGGFIAGAVHGVGNMLAAHTAKIAAKHANAKSMKMMRTASAAKAHAKSGGSGALHYIKGKFLDAKANKAKESSKAATKSSFAAHDVLKAKTRARGELANKINTKVLKTAGKVASAAGKMIG